jgi:hypothetical protein
MRIEDATDPKPPFRTLRFTPAEWRALLEDRSFLRDDDNSYAEPRRLMGLPVVIVPDHTAIWVDPAAVRQ